MCKNKPITRFWGDQYTYSDTFPKQTPIPNETDLEIVNPGGLLIIHVKQIKEETPDLLEALKNKETVLEEMRSKIGDANA